MSVDNCAKERVWDPWAHIPLDYNLGIDLSTTQVARGLGDKVVLHWENARGSSRSVTYRQLDAWSTNFATGLQRRGVGRGERVLLRLPNIPEFYVAAVGTAKLGGVFVPTSTQFRAAELEYRLRDCGARAIVTTAGLLAAVEGAAPHCPDLQHVIVVRYPDDTAPSDSAQDFASLIGEPSPGSGLWHPARTRHDDPAFIGYTSGTTGDPKGAVHLQRYPRAYEGLGRFWHDYRHDDIVACPSELGWLLPLATTFLYALSRGLTVVLYDGMGTPFDSCRWFRLIEEHRINNFTATPTFYRLLLADAERADGFDLSSWRHGVSCGEPLPAATLTKAESCFGVVLLDGLGMTECPVYCCNELGRRVRPGSCGLPSTGTTIAVLDEDMHPVADEVDGMLCVRRDGHPGITQGYWNKPDQTAKSFRGPWFVTGDTVRRDGDGYHWFRSRADDLIKSAGYLIAPYEIEHCLSEHPLVAEVAAVASRDALRGNIVKAFVVPRQPDGAGEHLERELRDFVRSRLAPYKCPRKFEFVTSLPKTTSGKTKRFQLRDV